MIKAVIDTNVIISGFFWGGPPKSIVAKMGVDYTAFASPEIIDEYAAIFQRYGKKTGLDTEPFFLHVLQQVVTVLAVPLAQQICEDPDDDMFIACAYACQADYVVTGDKKLLAAGSKAGINIVSPAVFLSMLK